MTTEMNKNLNKKGFFVEALLGKFVPDEKSSKKVGKDENGADLYKVVNGSTGWFLTTMSGHILKDNKFNRIHPTKTAEGKPNPKLFNLYMGSMYGNGDERMEGSKYIPGTFENTLSNLGLERNEAQFSNTEKKVLAKAKAKNIELTDEEILSLRDEIQVFTMISNDLKQKLVSLERTDTVVVVGRYNFADDSYSIGRGNPFGNQISLKVEYSQMFLAKNHNLTPLPYGKHGERTQYVKLGGKMESTPTIKIGAFDGKFIKKHTKIHEGIREDNGEEYKFGTFFMGTLDKDLVTDKMTHTDANLAREHEKNVVAQAQLDKYMFESYSKCEDDKIYLLFAREKEKFDVADDVIFSAYKVYKFAGRFNTSMNKYAIAGQEYLPDDNKLTPIDIFQSDINKYKAFIRPLKDNENDEAMTSYVNELKKSKKKDIEVLVRSKDKDKEKNQIVKTDFFTLLSIINPYKVEIIFVKK